MQGRAEILERLAWIENVTPRDKATIVAAMDEIANLRDDLSSANRMLGLYREWIGDEMLAAARKKAGL